MGIPLITSISEYLNVLKCNQTTGHLYVVLRPYRCFGRLHNVTIYHLAILPRRGPTAYDDAPFRKAYKSPTGLIRAHTDLDTAWVYL